MHFLFQLFAIFLQTLRGSFSAVSKPDFASKYSLESSWRYLQGLHAFAPLSIQNVSQSSSNFFAFSQLYLQNVTAFFKKLYKIHQFWWKFYRISAFFTEKPSQNLLDFQFSWDFATEITEFFRKLFSKSQKKLEKMLE